MKRNAMFMTVWMLAAGSVFSQVAAAQDTIKVGVRCIRFQAHHGHQRNDAEGHNPKHG